MSWDPRLVDAWRIVGYENRISPDHTFEQNRQEFAEFPSGAATTVFYELVLRDRALGHSVVLAEVEARWVHPSTGETWSQRSEVAGRTDAPFDSRDRYLRLGAIVGLAADRYSALSPQHENAEVDAGGVASDLAALLEEFDSLAARLGSLDAYRDFRFLLEWLSANAEELAPSSGYSQ